MAVDSLRKEGLEASDRIKALKDELEKAETTREEIKEAFAQAQKRMQEDLDEARLELSQVLIHTLK